MRAVVVFESMFGTLKSIAEAVAEAGRDMGAARAHRPARGREEGPGAGAGRP